MTLKIADSKGRIALGTRFANQPVIIETADNGELRIIPAAVIPEHELWLYRNPEARALVECGLAEARAGKFSIQPPELAADQKLVDQLED